MQVKTTKSRTRQASKSPSRVQSQETVVTKRVVVNTVQENVAVTPIRTSTRIASIIAKEVGCTDLNSPVFEHYFLWFHLKRKEEINK